MKNLAKSVQRLLIYLLGGYTKGQLEYHKALERYFECRRIRLYIEFFDGKPLSQYPTLVRNYLLRKESERERELLNVNEE